MDVREWIYGLCEGQSVGRKAAKNAIQSSTNGNYPTTLSEPFALKVGGKEVELPVGSDVVIYKRPTPSKDGGWLAGSTDAMATVFLKDDRQRTVGQVVIRMNGSVRYRRLD